MPERISDIPALRRELVDSMSPASAATLRATVLDAREPILFFASPVSALRAAYALSSIVLSEHRGLDTLYILAATAEDPINLANGMGAIGAASYVNGLVRTHDQKPFDLGLIETRYDERVKDFQGSLNGSPSGSFSAESTANSLRTNAQNTQSPDSSEVVGILTREVTTANPDRDLVLSRVVETSLLLALDTTSEDSTLKAIKEKLSTGLLTNSFSVFTATERLLVGNPEYFNLIFGRKASFWREYRDDLFPDLLNTANRIIEERAMIKGWQADPELVKTTEQLYYVASTPILKAQRDAETKRVALEKALAERATTQDYFETQWTGFMERYIQTNGPLEPQPSPFRDVDFLTGGVDILHKAIFEGKTETEMRAGLETIVPKFWPFRDLDFILNSVLSEYSTNPATGELTVTIPGQRVLSHLIYLPEQLRPQILGSSFRLSQEQQGAKNKIMRAFSKASHPDRNHPVYDSQASAIALDFVKVSNALHSLT